MNIFRILFLLVIIPSVAFSQETAEEIEALLSDSAAYGGVLTNGEYRVEAPEISALVNNKEIHKGTIYRSLQEFSLQENMKKLPYVSKKVRLAHINIDTGLSPGDFDEPPTDIGVTFKDVRRQSDTSNTEFIGRKILMSAVIDPPEDSLIYQSKVYDTQYWVLKVPLKNNREPSTLTRWVRPSPSKIFQRAAVYQRPGKLFVEHPGMVYSTVKSKARNIYYPNISIRNSNNYTVAKVLIYSKRFGKVVIETPKLGTIELDRVASGSVFPDSLRYESKEISKGSDTYKYIFIIYSDGESKVVVNVNSGYKNYFYSGKYTESDFLIDEN